MESMFSSIALVALILGAVWVATTFFNNWQSNRNRAGLNREYVQHMLSENIDNGYIDRDASDLQIAEQLCELETLDVSPWEILEYVREYRRESRF